MRGSRNRWTVAAAVGVAVSVMGALGVPARASAPAPSGEAHVPGWDPSHPGAAVLAGGDDVLEAERLEQAVDWHLWYRQAYEIDYADASRDPGVGDSNPDQRYLGVKDLTDTTDSALWTGTYLASQTFRYQVAKHYLAGRLTSGDRVFWNDQKSEALTRIKPLLDQYHLLSNISKYWTAPPPHTPSSNSDHTLIDTGVAPFPGGEAGLLFRSCIPDGVSRFPWTYTVNADGTRKFDKDSVYGPFPWVEPGSRPGTPPTQYYCEDATSRDAYAGATFGMASVFDLIDPADLVVTRPNHTRQSLHEQVGNDLMLLTQFLVDHNWSTPRPHSKISTKNDLSSFYSPLMVYTPDAKQHMMQLARHVADQMGTPAQKAEFDGIWQQEMATDSKGTTVSNEIDAMQPNDSYYKWNLDHLTIYDAIRLEENPTYKRDLESGYAVMDATVGNHNNANAHFETISYALRGHPEDLTLAVQHLRDWRAYRYKLDHPDPAHINKVGNYWVNNVAAVCDPPGEQPGCKPDSEDTVWVPNPADPSTTAARAPVTDTRCDSMHQPIDGGGCRAVKPIAIADRTPTDFLWQRSPFQLSGERWPLHESQGFDYLLPYWMLRYYTEVAPPANDPAFPVWTGPHYS